MSDFSVPRTARRVPIERQVRIKFENIRGFATEVSQNVSLGGMFIRTDSPPPVGTLLEIEFTLKDETDLIRGTGKVVWTRDDDEGADRPAGMGVRFVKLSPGSRELIFRVVDQHIQQGGDPFDLDHRLPPAAAFSALPPNDTEPPPAADGRSAFETPPGEQLISSRNEEEPAELLPALDLPAAETLDAPAAAAPAGGERGTGRRPSLEEVLAGSLGEETPRAPAAALTPPPPTAPAFEPPPAATDMESASPDIRGYGFQAKAARRSRRRLVALGIVLLLALAGAAAWWLDLPSWGGGAAEEQPSGVAAVAPPESARAPEVEELAGPAGPGPATEPAGGTGVSGTSATPPLPAAAPEPAAALTRLVNLTWRQLDGATEVVLEGDGSISEGSYSRLRLDGAAPREVIKLRGIVAPFERSRIAVGSPELEQVRTGYHAGTGGGELHVVLDLADPRVRVGAVETDGARLRLRLAVP